MSDRSLKSVTYFSFDQLSEEEQEERGPGVSTRLFPDFQLPQIGGKVHVPAARATVANPATDTEEFDSARVFLCCFALAHFNTMQRITD